MKTGRSNQQRRRTANPKADSENKPFSATKSKSGLPMTDK